MQILLASAKIMRDGHTPAGLGMATPRFFDIASSLAADLSRKGASELSELFGCSREIGELNRARFEVFGTDEAELSPAITAYFGQAYKHLKADELLPADITWANDHLWISSCLYGLLRPLDAINQYRMEGGFALPSTRGLKVQDYWKPFLTDVLIESVNGDDGVLVYLDTEEFRQLFDWKRVKSEVRLIVEPRFQVRKKGKMTTPSVWAKTCRGAMTRFIIENRIADPADLADFSYEGFVHEPSDSCEWLFVRTD